jgi:hypothetical protein
MDVPSSGELVQGQEQPDVPCQVLNAVFAAIEPAAAADANSDPR